MEFMETISRVLGWEWPNLDGATWQVTPLRPTLQPPHQPPPIACNSPKSWQHFKINLINFVYLKYYHRPRIYYFWAFFSLFFKRYIFKIINLWFLLIFFRFLLVPPLVVVDDAVVGDAIVGCRWWISLCEGWQVLNSLIGCGKAGT